MISMTVITSALELGFIYALVAMALFLSFRILNIADMTTDGSFTLGCAVSATVAVAGHPLLALPAAMRTISSSSRWATSNLPDLMARTLRATSISVAPLAIHSRSSASLAARKRRSPAISSYMTGGCTSREGAVKGSMTLRTVKG